MKERRILDEDNALYAQYKDASQREGRFSEGAELPLFRGRPMRVNEHLNPAEEQSMQQLMLPGMPAVGLQQAVPYELEGFHDWNTPAAAASGGDIFVDGRKAQRPLPEEAKSRGTRKAERKRAGEGKEQLRLLREALSLYVDIRKLRQLAAQGEDIRGAYVGSGPMPRDIQALLDMFALLIRPAEREQVSCPSDIAAIFLVEMGHLEQEQLRVACLNTKNQIQKIHLVYQGSVNAAAVRVGEIYKEPVRLNSTAIIVGHNHPSGEPNPSPDDIMLTKGIVRAGKMLDIECLDHLVIGQGRWMSLRERGLGFDY
jgi:DNA repair protein RadC